MGQSARIRVRARGLAETLVDLESADVKTCREAMRTLARCHKGQAVERLLVMLGDERAAIRTQAAYELGAFDEGRVVEALMRRFADTNMYVRVEVIRSLGRLWRNNKEYREQIGALVCMCLWDWRERVRMAAVEVAAGIWFDEQLGEALTKLLRKKDRALPFEKVAKALGRQDWDGTVHECTAILRDTTWNVADRVEVVRYLGSRRRGVEHALEVWEVLLEALESEEAQVRAAAVEEMGRVWGGAQLKLVVERLLAMFDDPATEVVGALAVVFGRVREGRAVERLLALLPAALAKGEEKLAGQIICALGMYSDKRAIESLLELLERVSGELLDCTVTALSVMQDPRVVEPLFRVLRARFYELEPLVVIEALGALGDRWGIDMLWEPRLRARPHLSRRAKEVMERLKKG